MDDIYNDRRDAGLCCYVSMHSFLFLYEPNDILQSNSYGFSSASYLAIVASCVATITPDPSQIGTRTGMFTASMGPGVLAGPAIAGALVALRSAGSADASVDGDTAQLKFLWAQAFSGSMLAVGAVFALCARVAVRRGWGKA